MNKVFYPRIAMTNLRNNGRTYVPYLLTCILSTAMFYVICSLSLNPDLDMMLGGGYMRTLLQMGTWIVGFFVIIFLFYTNSFLMKRRKKEFGVFNILGMEKRHISKVIAYETLFTALVSLLAGICLGIVLERLLYYALGVLMSDGGALSFNVSMAGIRSTLILFALIHLAIFLSSRWQIRLANPIQLLHGSSYGEREPKARWLMALLGLISLGAGYAIAVLTENPLNALLLFFVAVMLVIIGTYLLFTSGSIALFKLLRKNRRYYYKPTHFINTSTMMYRMKQNAVSLANICILSTMVLVMLSTTISLWAGMDDAAATRYPREISITLNDPDEESVAAADARIDEMLAQEGLQAQDALRYVSLGISAVRQGDFFETDQSNVQVTSIDQIAALYFIPLADYNAQTHQERTLDAGEALVYASRTPYEDDTLSVLGKTFKVSDHLDSFMDFGFSSASLMDSYFVVVADMGVIEEVDAAQRAAYGADASAIEQYIGFDLDGTPQQNEQFAKTLSASLQQLPSSLLLESRSENYSALQEMYGGFLFIGVFLSILFLMVTILILYYKQISEGYEDKGRFEIMQKVGMDHHEVKKVIRSQVLTVFFLPLIVAGIHIVFAFPMVEKLLLLLNLTNTALFVICTLICFAVFAAIYVLIYFMTSRIYYGIVRVQRAQ